MAAPLTPLEIAAALGGLPGWTGDGAGLVKTFRFRDFREAMAFMVRVAFEAEALNHHPDWTNVYQRVTVRLTTHDAGDRVTAKDVELAGCIERLAGPRTV